MDTVYRQWLILRMIPRRGRIATAEIRTRLGSEYGIETTLRTIQRDLVALEANFPLYCDGLRPAGWSWRKDAPAFDIPNMDPVTALTFNLAERHIIRMLPHGVLTALKPYFQTAEERLKQKSKSPLYNWPDKVRVVSRNMPVIPPRVSDDISETVYTALLEERRFMACYRTVSGVVREYEVSPLGLAFVEGLTYLVATLNDYEDPVLLLLHRILDVSPMDQHLTAPAGFNLDSYVARELSFPVGKDIRLKLMFCEKSDVLRLEEAPISDDQSVRGLLNGGFELTATVADTVQLHWWLRGYGERVKVLGPKRLREEFAELARQLSNKYL
jgi:predicted DNA-binding transcriptional regulator YafY